MLELGVHLGIREDVALGQLSSSRHLWLRSWTSWISLSFGCQLLLPFLLLSCFPELLHVNLKFSLHQATKRLHLGLQEFSFVLSFSKLQIVFQQPTLDEFILNYLYLSNQISAAGPAWHFLIDLFVFINNSHLLLEILFIC